MDLFFSFSFSVDSNFFLLRDGEERTIRRRRRRSRGRGAPARVRTRGRIGVELGLKTLYKKPHRWTGCPAALVEKIPRAYEMPDNDMMPLSRSSQVKLSEPRDRPYGIRAGCQTSVNQMVGRDTSYTTTGAMRLACISRCVRDSFA